MARDLLRQRLHVLVVVESRRLGHVGLGPYRKAANQRGSWLLGFSSGHGRPDGHELARCRPNHLGFLRHRLLVSFDVVVSETLDRLLFGLEVSFPDVQLDLLLPHLPPLRV